MNGVRVNSRHASEGGGCHPSGLRFSDLNFKDRLRSFTASLRFDPRRNMKPLTLLLLVTSLLLLSGCVNPAWKEFPEFETFRDTARGKYIGCLGYSLETPGYKDAWKKHSMAEIFIIPGTSDVFDGDEGLRWNTRAREFARRHNEWMRKIRNE